MPTQNPSAILFNIKIRIAGQRIKFSAPYQNSTEAINRIMVWLEQYFSDSQSPIAVIIQPAKLLH